MDESIKLILDNFMYGLYKNPSRFERRVNMIYGHIIVVECYYQTYKLIEDFEATFHIQYTFCCVDLIT